MTDVAALIADLYEAGVSPKLVGRVAAALAERETIVVKVGDEQAERRREKDRERHRTSRSLSADIRRQSADSADNPAPSSSPPTPPLITTPPQSSLRSENKNTSARKTTLREDAQPTQSDRQLAEQAGLSEAEFRDEWRAFRDHHCSRGNVMKNWHLAWSTWLRNGKRFKQRAGPQDRGGWGQIAEELFGVEDGGTIGKSADSGQTVRLLPIAGGLAEKPDGGDASGLSGNPVWNLASSSFRRM